jgi:hypothetical protein
MLGSELSVSHLFVIKQLLAKMLEFASLRLQKLCPHPDWAATTDSYHRQLPEQLPQFLVSGDGGTVKLLILSFSAFGMIFRHCSMRLCSSESSLPEHLSYDYMHR